MSMSVADKCDVLARHAELCRWHKGHVIMYLCSVWFLYMQISRAYRIYKHRHLYIVISKIKWKKEKKRRNKNKNHIVTWRNNRDDSHVCTRTCRRVKHSAMELYNYCNNILIFSYIYTHTHICIYIYIRNALTLINCTNGMLRKSQSRLRARCRLLARHGRDLSKILNYAAFASAFARFPR